MLGVCGRARTTDQGDPRSLKVVRFLLDEQLSERLCASLADVLPNSVHVRELGAGGAPDTTVWRLAQELGCTLVTKDEDFHRLSVLRGAPPKVVWLRIGNCTTEDVAGLLRRHAANYTMDRERNLWLSDGRGEYGEPLALPVVDDAGNSAGKNVDFIHQIVSLADSQLSCARCDGILQPGTDSWYAYHNERDFGSVCQECGENYGLNSGQPAEH